MMVELKICGLCAERDVALCQRYGVDMAGFVVDYPEPVPWNLTPAEAAPLLAAARGRLATCVVSGGPPAKVLELARLLRPDAVQLHYKESFAETVYLAEELAKLGVQVFKALPIRADGRPEMAEFSTLAQAVAAFNQTAVARLLLDSRLAACPAASSRPLSSELYAEIAHHSQKPLVLAGGLNAANLPGILAALQPAAVDILSGAEAAPRQKDEQKIAAICAACGKNK